MSPFARPPAAALDGKPVLIVSGSFDPIIPEENAARLAATLSGAGAEVEHRTLPTGHGLSQADLGLVQAWLARRPALAA
jgi:phospholipase/carboxylesterase